MSPWEMLLLALWWISTKSLYPDSWTQKFRVLLLVAGCENLEITLAFEGRPQNSVWDNSVHSHCASRPWNARDPVYTKTRVLSVSFFGGRTESGGWSPWTFWDWVQKCMGISVYSLLPGRICGFSRACVILKMLTLEAQGRLRGETSRQR